MTQIKDPRSNVVTIRYDSAERVGTITRPDGSTERVHQRPGIGLDQQRHVGQPGRRRPCWPQATSTYTDPNSNVTTLRPDWWGLGVTGRRGRRAGQRGHV